MKTTQEKIAVMQAFVDGQEIECRNNRSGSEWKVVNNPDWNWQYYNFRIKQDVPRTWEEFCKQYNEIKDEYYIEGDSQIYCAGAGSSYLNDGRDAESDANLLKTEAEAKGLLAQIKLKRLRDAWWGDWKPSFNGVNCEHCICKGYHSSAYDNLEVVKTCNKKHFLTFPTREMAEEFLSCFKDLIEQAEMWL